MPVSSVKRNWKRPSTVTPARLFPRYKGLSFRLQVSCSAFQSRKQALGIAAINGAKHICRESGCGQIAHRGFDRLRWVVGAEIDLRGWCEFQESGQRLGKCRMRNFKVKALQLLQHAVRNTILIHFPLGIAVLNSSRQHR